MRQIFLFLLLLLLLPEIAFSQLYSNRFRPPAQNWQELKNDHFRIIYPAGEEYIARYSARILELQYEKIREVTGGDLRNFPVILNTANDLSNGFVTPFNFRAEIEIPPIKGKAMNPRSGNWLELVLTHELVHALHMSINPAGLTSAAGLFSPDFRRSIHTAAPAGILEGLAVDVETRAALQDGGRGDYPYFTNRFMSNFTSSERWSMGQLVHSTTSTMPNDRHYIGGHEFSQWLHQQHGKSAMKEAIERHYKWPFLGFGYALKRSTGHWPATLYTQFTDHLQARRTESLHGKSASETEVTELALHGKKGVHIRRPLWIDDQTLLMHGMFYNSPAGFYLYNLDVRNFHLLLEHRSVEDFRFSFDRNRGELYFADYVTDGRYDNTYRARLFRFDMKSQKKSAVSHDNRLFAPSPGNRMLALQPHGSGNRIVSIDRSDESLTPFAETDGTSTIEEVRQHSLHNLVAVIARKGSVQALWVAPSGDLQENLKGEPDIAFENGSVFDLDWHSSQKKLLFSSDHTGNLNVYEYEPEAARVTQVTQSKFNAFEASYSPDGSRIAYIIHKGDRHIPVILTRSGFAGRILPPDEWVPSSPLLRMSKGPADQDQASAGTNWQQQSYQAGFSWLSPRTILPLYESVSNGKHKYGLSFMSTDPLAIHTYSASVSYLNQRPWHDTSYTYSGFHPGFRVSSYNRPSFPLLRNGGPESAQFSRFLLQNTGFSLQIPYHFTFERNTRFTRLSVTPEYNLSRVRFLGSGLSSGPLTSFKTLHSTSLHILLDYRIRQFRRDVQPNKGWTFFGQMDYNLNGSTFNFKTDGSLYRGAFSGRRGTSLGLFNYFSPLQRWNQSLRVGGQVILQTGLNTYSRQNLFSNAFSEEIFAGIGRIGYLSTRYTIPLLYPDDGGLLFPVYLSNIYFVLFSQTAGNLARDSFTDVINRSRTALGAGIRTRIKLSNLSFDLGVGFGYEPSRNQWSLIIGRF